MCEHFLSVNMPFVYKMHFYFQNNLSMVITRCIRKNGWSFDLVNLVMFFVNLSKMMVCASVYACHHLQYDERKILNMQ